MNGAWKKGIFSVTWGEIAMYPDELVRMARCASDILDGIWILTLYHEPQQLLQNFPAPAL